jgi:hypothetical protein
MDDKVIRNAVDDVQLIKQVIDNTSNSLTAFSRIFILWGILLIVVNLIGLAVFPANAGILNSPVWGYLIDAVIFIAAAAIYLSISKRTPLTGLSKKLMTIWVCILISDIIISFLTIILCNVLDVQLVNTFPVIVMSLAFGMLCMHIFTNYKFPAVLAAIYFLIAVFFWQCIPAIPYSVSFMIPYVSIFVLPSAFLILGFYLEFRRGRGISA